jgi:putative oxidoreductase
LQAPEEIRVDAIVLIGRILLAVLFIQAGIMFHIRQHATATGYARSSGVPFAGFLSPATGVLIALGGLMVALGIWPDLGALFLVLFLLPTAYYMHAFWKEQDPQMRANQQAHFMKNLALAGGALIAFALFAKFGENVGLTIRGPLFDVD